MNIHSCLLWHSPSYRLYKPDWWFKHFQTCMAHSERKVILFDAHNGWCSMLLDKHDSGAHTHVSSPSIHWHSWPSPQSTSHCLRDTKWCSQSDEYINRSIFTYYSQHDIVLQIYAHLIQQDPHRNSMNQYIALLTYSCHSDHSRCHWYFDENNFPLNEMDIS